MSADYYRVWQFAADQAIVKRGKLTIAHLVRKGEVWRDEERKQDFAHFAAAEEFYSKRSVMPQ